MAKITAITVHDGPQGPAGPAGATGATGANGSAITPASGEVIAGVTGGTSRLALAAREFPFGTGTVIGKAKDKVYNLASPPYSVDLTGNVDASAAVQQAVNDLQTAGYGGVIYHPYGRIKLSTTISVNSNGGILFEGGWGSGDGAGASTPLPPRYLWYGASTDNMFEIAAVGGGFGVEWAAFRRLTVMGASDTVRCKSAIVYLGRVDRNSSLEDVALLGATDYGIEYRSGGINIHNRRFSIDNCQKHGIRWVLGGVDSCSLSDFTIDGFSTVNTNAGGSFFLDGASAGNNAMLYLHVENGKVETNKNLPTGQAHFYFNINPANSSAVCISAEFDSVWEAAGGSITSHTGIKVTPTSDMQQLMLRNSSLSVVGVPKFQSTWVKSTASHMDSVMLPHSPESTLAPSAAQVEKVTVGQHNILGSVELYGRVTGIPFSTAATGDLNGATIYAGAMIMDPATRASGHRIVREATGPGTLGTLSGVTGTATSGTNTITMSDASLFSINARFIIGSEHKQVLSVDQSTGIVTVTSNFANSYSAQAVSWDTPAFRNGQFIPIAGSKTWAPGAIANTAGSNWATTTVTATGAIVGDFARASFTTVLTAGMDMPPPQVTAADTVTVYLFNFGTGSVTPASGTLRVQVYSQ